MWWLFACTDPVADEDPLEVHAELTDMPTVVRVDFEGTGVVHFDGRQTASATDSALLLGLPPETEVRYCVELEDGRTSPWQTLTTGPLPSGLPTLEVWGEAPWAWQALPLQGQVYAIVVLDPEGRMVWAKEVEAVGHVFRAMLSGDRQWIHTLWMHSPEELERSEIRSYSLDGSETRTISVPYADHDLVELPDGRLVSIVRTPDPEGSEANADRLVAYDAEGNEETLWNAWEALDLETAEDVHGFPNWTVGNGLDYVEEEDAFYLSLRSLGAIARIEDGETDWVLGSQHLDDFDWGETERLRATHQLERVDGGLLVFDNGMQERGFSRAVELAIDEDAGTVEQRWEYVRDPSVYVYAKGDVHRFEDGTTQVVWSTSGEIQRVSPSGEVLWQLNTDLGEGISYVSFIDDWYR